MSISSTAFRVQRVKASGTIYIRADGSVEGTDKIVSDDNATYYFTDNIYDEIVVERSNIIIDGDGCTLQGSGSGYGLYLSSVYLSNVRVQNTNIIGFDTGILIHYSSNIVIHGNMIANNSAYGIFVINSSYNLFTANILTYNHHGIMLWDSSNNNAISGNNMTNGDCGLGIGYSSNNIVSANNITNCSWWGIWSNADPPSSSSSNNTILENYIESTDGIGVWGSTNWTISGNTMISTGWGAMLAESADNDISENNITNSGIPIELGSSDFNAIFQNHMVNNSAGIHLFDGSSNNSMYKNTIIASKWNGIAFSSSSNNSVHDNNITANGNEGIHLYSSSNNSISGNNITDNNWDGIGLYESPSNTISGNNILNNGEEGIVAHALSGNISKLVVNNNKVILNRKNGIYLSSYYDSYIYNVTVYSNMISSNGENGIYATAQNHHPETIFDLEISDNIISVNHQKGVWLEGNINANLTCNSISYNTHGVLYTTTIDNFANYNDIYCNSHGMNVTNGATVNATYNYWGSSSGPYHETLNVNGTGNPLNGNGTDLDFIPFLADPIGQINERPIAVLEADETTVQINDVVTFNASASTDDCQLDYYFFDFGDGTNSSWTISPIIMHKYASGDVYNATLIVMDNLGVTSIQTNLTHVTITALAPPTANFSYEPEYPFTNGTVIFDASASFDPDGTVDSYTWDFGDGNTTTKTDPVITHVYTSSGSYILNLTVTDNDALNHSITESITIIEDAIAPITLHDYDGLWHTINFTIAITATDDLSGVAETYYRINDGPIQNVTINGQPLITTESDNNRLEYWSVDNADNEEPHHVLTEVKLDKVVPSIGIPSREPSDNIQPYQSVKISVNVTDTVSNVKNVTLHYTLNNGTTWEELRLMNYNSTTNLYEATIPGQQAGTWVEYKIVAYDNAGNNATLEGTQPYLVYQVVSEFPSFLILPLFMIATLLAVIVYKRKMSPRK